LQSTVTAHEGPVFALRSQLLTSRGCSCLDACSFLCTLFAPRFSHFLTVCPVVDKGFVSGGKDGVVILWDEQLAALKKYELTKAALARDSIALLVEKPAIRAIVLGQVNSCRWLFDHDTRSGLVACHRLAVFCALKRECSLTAVAGLNLCGHRQRRGCTH
jgi:hypothetical protein